MKVIPFSPPDITDAEIAKVADALKSGWITTGPMTKLFEKKIAEYCNTENAVCLNSATACLELTLHTLGIKPGDEIITSAYTYTASASPAVHIGASVVMVDCCKDSYEIDYDAVEAAITPRTKVIVPVDVGGILCDYDRLKDIAERKRGMFVPSNDIQRKIGRIAIVADGAHSFGAHKGNVRSGALADFSTFSFHAVKNLTTAEGGAVTWAPELGLDNKKLYTGYQLMSLHGQSKDALAKNKLGAWEYDIVAPLYKCNMTDIMAAIGLVQLDRYQSMLDIRYRLVKLYGELLADCDIELPKHFCGDMVSSCHLYQTRLLNKTLEQRNEVIQAMANDGISANVHYKPLPMMTAYKALGFDIKNYPNAYARFQNEVTLPLYSTLTENDVERVCASLKSHI